jgi:hypothetical protein
MSRLPLEFATPFGRPQLAVGSFDTHDAQPRRSGFRYPLSGFSPADDWVGTPTYKELTNRDISHTLIYAKTGGFDQSLCIGFHRAKNGPPRRSRETRCN